MRESNKKINECVTLLGQQEPAMAATTIKAFFTQIIRALKPKKALPHSAIPPHVVEKVVRTLQKMGFILHVSKESAYDSFCHVHSAMKRLNLEASFIFTHLKKTDPQLDLLVFSQDKVLSHHIVDVTEAFDVIALLEKHAPSAIPLNQLQDIAGWLDNHGAHHASHLTREALEKKLESLIHQCPHGAYVLHPIDKALMLSRLSPKGTIEHMLIHLQKQLGCYTLEVEGTLTRAQFKKRLQQMGTPIRLTVR